MGELRKRERAAVDAVARHVSASWKEAPGASPAAYLTVGGRRIAVEVAVIKTKIAAPTKPRLRFDKVVLRLMADLRARLGEVVPDGQAVIVTVTAPIRLPAKTAAALEDEIRGGLLRKSAKVEIKDAMHGNRVRARLVKDVPRGVPKVIGFVHNPDTDADVLLGLTQSLIRLVGAAAERSPKKASGERWLVIADDDGLPLIEAYRQVYAELSIVGGFKKILLVLPGGRVEHLIG
jgi:hypothetical protein